MRALTIGNEMPRLAATKLLSMLSPRAFVGPLSTLRMREIPEPALPAADWAVARTALCGLCGSDYKQVFMNGSFDNPMTAMISWPQVLGHEVVGVIDELGPGVTQRKIGERVVLNPWLSCVTRGLPPFYFKELSIVGSNGFGIEEHDGRRQHAMEWYFEFIRTHGFDGTPIITHRFPLEAYKKAFLTCWAQGDHAAVKVLFDRFGDRG